MRTFKSAKKRAKKSAFTNKSAQKNTLKSTFGSSEPICEKVLADQYRFFQSNVSFRFYIILSSTPGVKNRFHVMWAEPVWGVISGSTDREERRIKNREHDMTRPLR